mmetsp:Transcript_24957/g.62903  ORF Transcript_24957/g.62903 Transcript_24957/m.62903 type:complete len:326 (-) Transcript_24957:466-1443(-)|eukprot:jgi/Tetstr1/421298/TSEL_012271.t1
MLRFSVGMGGMAGALGTTAYLAGTAADMVLSRLEASVAAQGKGVPGVTVSTPPRSSSNNTLAAESPAWVWQDEEDVPLLRSDSSELALLNSLAPEASAARRVRSPARLVAPARRRTLLSSDLCDSPTAENEAPADACRMYSVRDFPSSPSQSGSLGASPVPARHSLHRRSASEDSCSSFVNSGSSLRRRHDNFAEPARHWWGAGEPDPARQVDMVARFLNDVLEQRNITALADLCSDEFRFSERNVDFGKATENFEGVGIQEFAECLASAAPLPGRAALESVATDGHKVMVHFDGEAGGDSNDHLLIFHLDPASNRISQLVTCRA